MLGIFIQLESNTITDPPIFNQGNRPFSRELAINRFTEPFQYSDYVLDSAQ